MAVIKISGLKKSYGKKEVLNIPDLQIRMNSISAFIGKNGAGKTTLMRILCGLQTPTEGSVQIEPQMSALIETLDWLAHLDLFLLFLLCFAFFFCA